MRRRTLDAVCEMTGADLACSLTREYNGLFLLRVYWRGAEVLHEEFADRGVAAARAAEACQQIARDARHPGQALRSSSWPGGTS
jgi:hypothetical protein